MAEIKEDKDSKEKKKEDWLIIGLGNPYTQCQANRHNIGHMVLNNIVSSARLNWKKKQNRRECYYKYYSAYLIKPWTGMNVSGEIFEHLEKDYRVILIYDDLDLPLGSIRVKPSGGSGGHNGVKSIIKYIGEDFVRIRLGIGRPNNQTILEYVLNDFSNKEQNALNSVMEKAVEAIARITQDGIQSAMNEMNRRDSGV